LGLVALWLFENAGHICFLVRPDVLEHLLDRCAGHGTSRGTFAGPRLVTSISTIDGNKKPWTSSGPRLVASAWRPGRLGISSS
jgi:hypothetical protein